MLEKDFQKKVLKFLSSLPNSWFIKTSERSLIGIPDIIGCIHGIFVALELKRSVKTKSRSRTLQEATLKRILANGGVAGIVGPENWEDTKNRLLFIEGEMSAKIQSAQGSCQTVGPTKQVCNPSLDKVGEVIELSKYKNRKKGF